MDLSLINSDDIVITQDGTDIQLNFSPESQVSQNTSNIEKLTPIVLYTNDEGDNGNITLSDSVANYTYIEIFYKSSDKHYGSTKIFSPNGKRADLFSFATTGSTLYIKSKCVSISGVSISNVSSTSYGETNISSSTTSFANNNLLYITRVIGYKVGE